MFDVLYEHSSFTDHQQSDLRAALSVLRSVARLLMLNVHVVFCDRKPQRKPHEHEENIDSTSTAEGPAVNILTHC